VEKERYAETLYLEYASLILRGVLIIQLFERFVLFGVGTCA